MLRFGTWEVDAALWQACPVLVEMARDVPLAEDGSVELFPAGAFVSATADTLSEVASLTSAEAATVLRGALPATSLKAAAVAQHYLGTGGEAVARRSLQEHVKRVLAPVLAPALAADQLVQRLGISDNYVAAQAALERMNAAPISMAMRVPAAVEVATLAAVELCTRLGWHATPVLVAAHAVNAAAHAMNGTTDCMLVDWTPMAEVAAGVGWADAERVIAAALFKKDPFMQRVRPAVTPVTPFVCDSC